MARLKGSKDKNKRKSKPPKQICINGHDTFICGRDNHGACVLCKKEYVEKHLEQSRASGKRHYERHKKELLEKRKDYQQKYRDEHKEERKKYDDIYRKEHAVECKLYYAKNKVNRRFRYVLWGQEGILDFVRNKPIDKVIDHYIPLQGNFVSGLNVIWNLQYLTPKKNGSKGNKCNLIEVSEWYGKILEEAGLKGKI